MSKLMLAERRTKYVHIFFIASTLWKRPTRKYWLVQWKTDKLRSTLSKWSKKRL